MKRYIGFVILCTGLMLFATSFVPAAAEHQALTELERRVDALLDLGPPAVLELKDFGQSLGTVEAIYDYVTREIAYEVYQGRLRGPDGTLQSGSGNDVDQSELLVALLQSIGEKCRYARGKRQTSHGEQVDHLWVQIQEDDIWKDLDPAFAELVAQEKSRRAVSTMAVIPDNLIHKVHLEVKFRLMAAGKKEERSALVREFEIADLYNCPLTLANRFTGHREEERYVVEAVQSVLQVGEELHTGEVISETEGEQPPAPASRLPGVFDQLEEQPSSSQPPPSERGLDILSQWVEVQLVSPGLPRDRFIYTLFDREQESDESLSSLHGLIAVVAFGFSPATVTDAILQRQVRADIPDIRALAESLGKISSKGSGQSDLSTSFAPADAAVINLALENGRRALAWTVLQSYFMHSDEALRNVSGQADVSAYRGVPRAVMASVSCRDGKIRYDLDLRRNPATYTIPDDEPAELNKFLNYNRGIFESRLEGEILKSFAGHAGITAGDVLAAAEEQKVPVRVIVKKTRADLKSCTLDRPANTLINKALNRGKTVVLPEKPVILAGVPRMAWYEYNPQTGYIEGVFPSGKHQAMTEYILEDIVIKTLVSQGMSYFSSMIAGYYFSIATGLGHFYACLLDLEDPGKPCFGTADVCGPAKADAVRFCKAWSTAKEYFDMGSAAMSMDLAGLVPWPDAWKALAGEPCEHGASYGLKWFGCKN